MSQTNGSETSLDLRTDSTLASSFEINEQLSRALERWLSGLEKLSDDPLPAQLAVMPMLPRASKLHRSIVLLCAAGHGENALMLLRALQELALNARYIAQDPLSDRAERWVQFSVADRYEFLQTFLEDPDFAESRARVDPNDPTIIEVQRLADDAQERFHFWRTRDPNGKLRRLRPWAGVDTTTGRDITIRRISQLVGWESEYRTLYSMASRYVHAGLQSVEHHVHFDEQSRVQLSAAPGLEHVDLVLTEAYPYVLSIAGEWCNVLRAPDVFWDDFRRLRSAYAGWYAERIGEQEATAKLTRLLDQKPFVPSNG
jgi:hypothetical protein